ncbi:MAG: hypothetical protein ACRDHZ_11900, partial [Ktedonobacteraceae bacterium]
MSKRQERQRFIRHYKDVTGGHEIDMHKVAEFAKKMGWAMPRPPSDIELLAKLFVTTHVPSGDEGGGGVEDTLDSFESGFSIEPTGADDG